MTVSQDAILELSCIGVRDLCRIAREDSIANGWHDTPHTTPERIALMHSELSEALECDREHEPELHYDENGKPLGIMSEYADVIIRICDAVGPNGGELLAEAVRKKVLFNRTRGYKHGGKAY